MFRVFIFTVFYLICIASLHGQSGVISNFETFTATSPTKEVEVKGHLYYFDTTWAHAKVILADNSIIQNDSLYYNFNKLSQSLLVTKDFKKVYEVDNREFKSLTFLWHDSIYIFEHVYAINKVDFFLELVREDTKYSLYKFTNTTVNPINWRSTGLASEGKMYEEVVDNPVYYIVFPNQQFRMLSNINKKTIEHAFTLNADSKKVEDYLLKNSNKTYGEDFLWELILYLNE